MFGLNSDLTSDRSLQRSLNFVILGITFGIVFFNVTTGSPVAGFAKAIGFGDLMYGIMLALPVLGGVAQVFASFVLEKSKKRKSIFLISGFLHRLPWVFIAILPLFLGKGSYTLLFLLIAFMTISSISNSFTNVSFWSWMGDLIPEHIRGRFFSRRATISTIVGMLSGLAIGKFLDLHNNLPGFSIIFVFAAIMGMLDISCFFFVKDLPMKNEETQLDLKKMFFSTLNNHYFRRFMMFFVIWNFGLNIAGPYFNMYMIKDLKMSYFEIILLTQIVSNVVTIITLPYIGRIVDKIGNRPMLLIATGFISLLPIIWCFTSVNNYKVLVTIISIFAGLLWPIIDMGNNNLILKLSDQSQTSMYVAVINLFNAIFGSAIPIILGGYFIEDIAPVVVAFLKNHIGINVATYHVAFFTSGLIRFLAVIYLKKNVKEPGAKSLKNVIINKIKVN
ncbi:major facilitator superfamily MFS_1 [Caldicellulosiruptor saccharolyticus DSM 8903]|uniref:Major facilitator superfamily MFS_1 n=1 Tax=Caldicellulosiruptor saccharolyticus (strain ATCC 43494 / DSM 8903 / Tp8T 6331) TaxID=351627 RepID=A4XLB7_CALS8|nr:MULTISPECIES: MFS transporter [Caldicellulosiruptor]ABP67702.1 major facilitator superfamily MFS_1 [Caldicellulosiruptor saccharolyticus DSM 8903]